MRCRICKRTLTDPDAIKEGIGPICKRKAGLDTAWKLNLNDGDTDIIESYDGGDIWIKRVPCPTLIGDGHVGMATHTASGIKTNVPRQIYKHSPAGYNFGYGGSGPSDFALNICLLFCKHAADAYSIYHTLKAKFLQTPGDELTIRRAEIEVFLTEQGMPTK